MFLQWNTIFLIYLKLLFVSCARNSSLTFVIDDTGSMYDDIRQVRKAAEEIMDIVKREKASEIENVVLVTFNDPYVEVRENSNNTEKHTLLQALRGIKVDGGGDCPEYAMSGIEKALQESKPASYLFVFTDASAKDHYKVNRVTSLCQKKQSQVVFILTDDCNDAQSVQYKVYHEIAMKCNGQVFRVHRDEVQDVLKTVKETIKGQRTVVTSQVVPRSQEWVSVPFTIDDQSEYVIVSTSGKNVDLIINDISTNQRNRMTVNKIMWKSSGKVVKFNAPKPGTYYAWVKADTDISIVVYARTDFSFNHGFSSMVPKSLEDTSKQPIKGEWHYLSITVDDPNNNVDIGYAEILNMDEQVIEKLPLMKEKGNYYITKKFVSPSSTFKIRVTGINKNTRNDIKRMARTNIDPQDPPEPDYKAPTVVITEGLNIDVDYAGDITLTCKVSAYPKPEIVWASYDGDKISADSNLVEKPYDYISYLYLKNVRKAEKYYCKASNNLARSVMAKIHVKPRNPLTAIELPAATTIAKFGKEIKLVCNVASKLPLEIKWKVPLKPSDYIVSADHKVLTIKAVNMDAQGMYTCDTTLKSDPKYKITAPTTLTIGDLEAPKIYVGEKTITVMKGQSVSPSCRVIGVPTPTVTWQFKAKGSNTFVPLKTRIVQITNTGYNSAGTYMCIATNELDTQSETIDIIVHGKPEITNADSVYYGVKGDKVLQVPCEVTGVPEPAVVWKQGGKIVTSEPVQEDIMVLEEDGLDDDAEPVEMTLEQELEMELKIEKENFNKQKQRDYEKVLKKEMSVYETEGVQDGKITVNKNSLYLKDPTAKDSSNFTCEAKNKYGSAKANLFVDISDFIEPEKVKSTNIYLKQGDSTEDIKCDLPNAGPSSIRWYVNADLSAVKSLTYSLQNANFSNDGNYTCRVNTDQGSESLNYVVDVGFLPSFLREPTSPINWNGNKKDILDCNVDAKPKVNTVWHFNGNEVQNKVPELFIMGWGRYTCSVTNVHGSVQRSFDVTNTGCIINRTVDNNLENTPLLINGLDSTWPKLNTDSEFYTLDKNETIYIQCVTKRNAINTFKIQPKTNKITARCYKEDQFIVDGNKYKFENLQCKEYVMPSFEFTKKPCMKNGEVIKVGFALYSGFLSAYDVCYEQANHKTLYTKVLMSDQNLGNKVDSGFKVDTELSNVGQIVKCQYNKRRLVNPVDVAFGPAQAATLSEYNSVPVFEPCDGSNRNSWSALEEAVNIVLEDDNESFIVWSGASQYDAAGVPRYLWKVAMIDDNLETLVFVNAPDVNIGDIHCSKHDNEKLVAQFTDNDNDPYMYACSKDDFFKQFNVPIDEFKET